VSFPFNKTSHMQDEIAPLTSFRFITAFMVFISHCGDFIGLKFGVPLLDALVSNSSAFITGFFVLSGYILTYVYSGRDFSSKEQLFKFYLKRFARIYPVYIFATFVFFFIFKPSNFTSFDWLRVIVNDVFLTQSFFLNMDDMGLNCITWSISVEAFFYLVFPLIMLFFVRRPKILLVISLLLSFIVTVNLIGDLHTAEENVRRLSLYYAHPLFRLNEFMLGISFYLMHKNGSLQQMPRLLKSNLLVFALLIGLTVSDFSNQDHSHMGAHFFITPLFGLLIWNFHCMKTGVFKNSFILNYLGRISYSFYVWQFIAVIIGVVIKRLYAVDPIYITLIILPLNVIISALSYHYIEEPCRRLILQYSNWSSFFAGQRRADLN